MTAMASSTQAATSGCRSSKKFLRATPTRSPATLSSSAAQSLGAEEPASATSAPSRSAASRTVRVIGPGVSNDVESGTIPSQLSQPALGRCPTIPQSAAGQRIEPAVSVPIAAMQSPAATAAAEPDEDPPVMRCKSHGFFTGPNALTMPLPPNANSCRFSLPISTAPACFNWRTSTASCGGNPIAELIAGCRGKNAGGIEQVFQPNRNAVQRPSPSARHDFRFSLPRLLQRKLRRDGDESVQGRIQPLDARQAFASEFHRRKLAAFESVPRLR